MEGDAAVEERKSACTDVARLILSILIMLVLVWVVHTGYRLATEAREENGSHGSEYNYVVVTFGVVTVVFGLIYFIVGLTIVAELGVDLSTWVQTRDMETTHDQGKEQKTICQLIIQTSVTMGSMFMLSWAIYHGYKLAMEAPKGGIYNGLAFLIGFTAMGFGFIYFMLGIGIIAESTLYLSSRLRHVMESDNYQNLDADAYLAV